MILRRGPHKVPRTEPPCTVELGTCARRWCQGRLLDRRGFGDRDHSAGAADGWAAEAPVLAGLAAASVQGSVALGRRRGARVRRLGRLRAAVEAPAPGRCQARSNGFDLHAGLVVSAGQRERLERVCRYTLRPPVSQERVRLTGEGLVQLQLRHPWADGTTHLVFDPLEFLGRLAVLVPRPRINLVLYHGVLGPRAAWRSEVVRHAPSESGRDARATGAAGAQVEEAGQAAPPDAVRCQGRGQCWAALMQRTFGFDVLACPQCGGRLRLIALIEAAAVIGRILQHLGLPTAIPAPRPARAPPRFEELPDATVWAEDPSLSLFDSCS